ncbi:DUF6284 family protein [Actinoplanes subtropicus]|uniref:DUF6284 family protein n=1 Tax=Actinoplanes subtropicus TaxID=543632 RepID=UPI0004C4345E|nr:DUF6284 family protein [Actinoplanes subtropicus]
MPRNFDSTGPTRAELAAIEAEWPAIQADIDALADPDYVDALVDAIDAVERVGRSETDRRRQRRQTARITRAAVTRKVAA